MIISKEKRKEFQLDRRQKAYDWQVMAALQKYPSLTRERLLSAVLNHNGVMQISHIAKALYVSDLHHPDDVDSIIRIIHRRLKKCKRQTR